MTYLLFNFYLNYLFRTSFDVLKDHHALKKYNLTRIFHQNLTAKAVLKDVLYQITNSMFRWHIEPPTCEHVNLFQILDSHVRTFSSTNLFCHHNRTISYIHLVDWTLKSNGFKSNSWRIFWTQQCTYSIHNNIFLRLHNIYKKYIIFHITHLVFNQHIIILKIVMPRNH